MLACARIGAPHSVVFGGFSPDSLSDRINDARGEGPHHGRRGMASRPGRPSQGQRRRRARRHAVDRARGGRAARPRTTSHGARPDHWYHELMADARAECPAEPMDSEHLLYLLYTSGTTAKPKGIMHTTGGYLTQVAFTHKYVFDLHPDEDVYWCAADIGWVTGHSYIVYGPLCNGATSVMYEGTPDHPAKDRWWDIIERYKVTILYTAPTAIRTFMKWGDAGAREARPLVAAAPRIGRRAHQPRSVDVVLAAHRRRPVPGRRHVVADRDRRNHDQPAAGRHHVEARLGDVPVARDRGRGRRRPRQARRSRWWLPHSHPSLALDAAWHLRRSRALQEDLLEPLRGPVLRRRRSEDRRRGLLLAARAGSTTS